MKITDLSISFNETPLYTNFSIEFKDAAITAIMGASGCGKTTLLNAIASPSAQNSSESDYHVSYIFQEPRLLPWRSLEKNIILALHSGTDYEKKNKARYYLDRVGLAHRATDFPDRLSGGERQRVSIARSFACQTPVLLMDEPFQSQDPAQKIQLINLIKELQKDEQRTIIAVTHDVKEASALAERAVVLGGKPVTIILDIPVNSEFESHITEVLTSIW